MFGGYIYQIKKVFRSVQELINEVISLSMARVLFLTKLGVMRRQTFPGSNGTGSYTLRNFSFHQTKTDGEKVGKSSPGEDEKSLRRTGVEGHSSLGKGRSRYSGQDRPVQWQEIQSNRACFWNQLVHRITASCWPRKLPIWGPASVTQQT